jgi:hypothetical protein
MAFWNTLAKVGGALVGGPVGYFAGDALTGGDDAKKVLGAIGDATGLKSVKGPQASYLGGNADAYAAQLARTGQQADQNRAYQGSAFGQQMAEQQRQLEVRDQQGALAQALAQQAAGQGPSVAQAQMRGALDANQQQAMAMAAGARGNTALAQRNAMNAGSQANLQAGAQMAAMRAQEQLSAQSQLAGVLGQQRGMDLEGRGMYGQQAMGLGGQAMDAEALRQQAMLGQLDADTQHQVGAYQGRMADQQGKRQFFGGLVGTAGSLAMLSDERTKEGAEDATDDVAAMLAGIKPSTYRYKDQRNGAGQQYGLMAQDLERSAMGAAMVQEGADGLKRVDVGRAALGSLAAASLLAKRLDKLERKGG